MKKYNVAILGATGAVGMEMIKVLEERNFPVAELKLLASQRSVGKKIPFRGKDLSVCLAEDSAFSGMDIVLGAAENDIAKKFAPAIVKAGAVFVDNSSAFRMCDDVPLVVPEINGDDAKKNNGIIANPNCSTIITLMALSGIAKLSKITSMVASTYQAVSGAGIGGFYELEQQTADVLAKKPIKPQVFKHRIAFNLIPQIGGEAADGYTTEEMKLQNESRKIMHLPDLKATCTCVRVPVMRSHSISVTVKTEEKLDIEKVKEAISKAEGCRLVDDLKNDVYPMPIDTSDQNTVFVGRVRRDLTDDNGITLWCCGDQVRKGAAENAVQIAELLV